MAAYLTEATVPSAEAQSAAYYAQDRGSEEAHAVGMGTTPMPRRDLDPALAQALGVTLDRALTVEEFANVLSGRHTNGSEWPTAPRATRYQAKTNEDGIAIGNDRVSISYIDLTLQAPRSVSVAWAFAPEAERQSIVQAHRNARDMTLAYIEKEIAKAGFGEGHAEGSEAGRMAWITCDHYTARPTLAINRADAKTGVMATELIVSPGGHVAGDMHLHTHCIVPNLMTTDSGRMIALNRDTLKGRIHEFGSVYQALLAQELRTVGFDAGLDPKTGMARMTAVPEHVVSAFSKRTQDAHDMAHKMAAKAGLDWDAMSGDDKIKFIHNGAKATREPKAEIADAFSWRQQARGLNYDPQSFMSYGPPRAELSPAERISQARDTALPLFSDELTKRAVVTGGDARQAAARGLIDWGIDTTADVGAVTKRMAREGVMQDGQCTSLIWREDARGRVKITTALHKSQEEELIGLGKRAAADMRMALPLKQLNLSIKQSGLDFTNEHGAAQRAAIETLGTQGGLAVMIGSAGVGKTKAVLPPLVSAWKEAGYTVWGTALAWRQARELADGGIDRINCRAMEPFINAAKAGHIELNNRSVIVLDEVSQIGTRQLLELMRLRDASGAKIVAMGDPRQCQAIEAGPVVELLRKSLGEAAIPQIHTTVRQQTEEERRIVGLFRDGAVAEAVAAKRSDGTAELVPGGYRQAIHRIAALYAEKRAAHPDFSISLSAPTNADAREISLALRKVKSEQGQIGPDMKAVSASDGRGDDYTMRLASGDNIRLFQQTRAVFTDDDGRKKSAVIGDNGSVLTIDAVLPSKGLQLRSATGKVGFTPWEALQYKANDKLAMTYGDCGTIDSSQGITSDVHIHAFPSGSQSVSGFKNYVAQSRHRVESLMVGSMGAEMKGAVSSRPMGMPEPTGRAAVDDAWANVVRNFGKVPIKESALAMLTETTGGRRKTTGGFQATLRTEQSKRLGPSGAERVEARKRMQVARRSTRAPSQRPRQVPEQPQPTPQEAKVMTVFADLVAKRLMKPEEATAAMMQAELRKPVPTPDNPGARHIADVFARTVSRGSMTYSEALDMLVSKMAKDTGDWEGAEKKAARLLDQALLGVSAVEQRIAKSFEVAVEKASKPDPTQARSAAVEASRRAQQQRGAGHVR